MTITIPDKAIPKLKTLFSVETDNELKKVLIGLLRKEVLIMYHRQEEEKNEDEILSSAKLFNKELGG